MKKTGIITIIILLLLGLIAGLIIGWLAGRKGLEDCQKNKGPLNATYNLEGELFTLSQGEAEKKLSQTGGSSVIKVKIWEEPVYGDLNSDGISDAALIFTYEDEDGFVDYYVSAAIKDETNDRYDGLKAVFLGEEISPKNLIIKEGSILIDYDDRGQSDSISVKPYIALAKTFFVESNQLKELDVFAIGGQRDDFGCLGPAGYSWDSEIEACIRPWEINEAQREAVKIAVDYVGSAEGITILEARRIKAKCDCFYVLIEKNGKNISVNLVDSKITKVEEHEY